MEEIYTPRVHMPLASGTIVEHPSDMPEKVAMADPAKFVLIDFTNTRPTTIAPHVLIDAAMEKMHASGAHMLLVTDELTSILGVVSACDIMGEAPVREAGKRGIHHSEITVEMIMTPRDRIEVIDWSYVQRAKVGHIVATMHELDSCILPVVEQGRLRGMFCASDMSRHIGHDISEPMVCRGAHSFADIVFALDAQ